MHVRVCTNDNRGTWGEFNLQNQLTIPTDPVLVCKPIKLKYFQSLSYKVTSINCVGLKDPTISCRDRMCFFIVNYTYHHCKFAMRANSPVNANQMTFTIAILQIARVHMVITQLQMFHFKCLQKMVNATVI